MSALDLHWLQNDASPFPPTAQALGADSEAPGLLAVGGQLSLKRLEAAYRHGIFPWYSEGQPVLWWAPDPRMVLPVADFKLGRSLRKTIARFMRTPGCELRIDSAFERVIQACAGTPRQGQRGTWILAPLQQAYTDWHRAGRVHSVETWIDGQLVGGLYGVGIGRMFFGESMFSHANDASKIALAALVAFCRAHGIALIDCQQNTKHLASLGAQEISRAAFERHLALTLGATGPPRWSYDPAHWALLGLDTTDARA
ncbi:MAG: leucyl/phenylalanyl-tRNA--protein transferase [Burkholderiaceae bacterium]|nr:leucyl/phenylalanyl-tRNA--protein transferase [Burkholderiaceae bacterium]